MNQKCIHIISPHFEQHAKKRRLQEHTLWAYPLFPHTFRIQQDSEKKSEIAKTLSGHNNFEISLKDTSTSLKKFGTSVSNIIIHIYKILLNNAATFVHWHSMTPALLWGFGPDRNRNKYQRGQKHTTGEVFAIRNNVYILYQQPKVSIICCPHRF